MRAILQLFNIKVLVYPQRVEIKGAIPTQVLDKPSGDESETALIISSPPPSKERGQVLKKRGYAPLEFPYTCSLVKGKGEL